MDVHEAVKTSEKLIASKLISIKLKNRLVRKTSATLEINVFLHSKRFLLLRFVCYCLMRQMLSRFIFYFFKFYFILFIYGCVGSSFLCERFL